MEFIEKKCPYCGGLLKVPDNLDTYNCMYCGKKIEPKVSEKGKIAIQVPLTSDKEELEKLVYAEGPSLIIGQLKLMESFKADTYEKAFTTYFNDKGKIILALSGVIEEKLTQSDVSAEKLLLQWGNHVIDEVDKQLELTRKGKTKSKNIKMIEEVRYILALYTVPMIREVRAAYSERIAEVLHRLWCERYPGQKFELAEYQVILSGFQKRKLCFITTAVCESLGKPDNCAELQAFRRFRDQYMMKQPEGQTLIEQYYDLAPQIVNRIQVLKEKKEIYKEIWEQHLCPCYQMLQQNEWEQVTLKYTSMVEQLCRTYVLS